MYKKTVTLFYGGVVNLGRNMNSMPKNHEPFVGIEEMATADLRLADLECVISTKGEQQLKNNPAYFRARPEQTNILTKADIDIVLTANDHSGDYGAEALLEQREYLDVAGILHTGSGKNFSEAFEPVYKKIGDIVLAIFSVDTIMPIFAATDDKPGTAHLPANNLELWKEIFADRIHQAHEKADVVIVAPHWGANVAKKSSEQSQKIGHLLIDLGADAILGCNSHLVHGVENYKNRPIIYDAGDLLFDQGRRNGGCFTLKISSDGVENVKFIPLTIRAGQTSRAGDTAEEIIKNFIALCDDFKTVTTSGEGIVEISFNPPPREEKIIYDVKETDESKYLIEPLTEPRPEWIVDKVPDEAIIPPKNFGSLKLVGYYVPPECRIMTERKMLQVETYWTIEEPLDKDYRLSVMTTPVRECLMPPYNCAEHEFLDFMWPINRWKPGVIYREKIGLVPPAMNRLVNIDLQVKIKVTSDEKIVGEFEVPSPIEMKIENLRYPYIYDKEFDNIIYKSESGKCWTAEQLAKVTGGKWVVPPPKGWYTDIILRNTANSYNIRPALFLAISSKDHLKIRGNTDNFDAAIITFDVEGLPPNFPLLKVNDSSRAMYELGFAARKRFQGKVIAVTGSAGKTTTCNMLSCVLGKDHKIKATPGSSNMYGAIPRIFASVKQDEAYAIIELSIDAFEKLPGSICYDIMPHVAVVTSIAPAHIGRRGSLEEIARRKSKILCGMTPGNYAVLNRDMPCYEIFEEKAKNLNLNIITFGTHADAVVRMPVMENGGKFFAAGKAYKLSCPVPPEQIYDALAVVGVSLAVGFPVEKTLEYLKIFEPVEGRGNVMKIVHDGKNLTIINSAFNANPDSMKYSLQHIKTFEPNQKSRVAILGDIAALGDSSEEYHKGLADAMLAAEPDRLLLCGEFMRYPYEMIKNKINVIYFETLEKLLAEVESHLRDGDSILIKSSHATGLSKVVDLLSKNTPPTS